MPRFAANLSLLFTELPYSDRFDAAANAGFEAVEVLFPYDVAAKETRHALLRNGFDLVLMNAPPPNYTGGDPGYAATSLGEGRFEHDMVRTLRYAHELKPGLIHVMAGYEQGANAQATFVRNLRWLADLAPEQGFSIEPLNSGDQPGYFLDSYKLAAEVLDQVSRQNVGLQYDTYHAQVIHGDAAQVWADYGDRAVHVQIGAAPGRTEPGRGQMDFAHLFSVFDGSGYSGWVSAEYNPTTRRTEDSLHWMR